MSRLDALRRAVALLRDIVAGSRALNDVDAAKLALDALTATERLLTRIEASFPDNLQ